MIRKKTVEAWMDVIVYAVLKVYQNLKNKGNSKVWKQMLAIAFLIESSLGKVKHKTACQISGQMLFFL